MVIFTCFGSFFDSTACLGPSMPPKVAGRRVPPTWTLWGAQRVHWGVLTHFFEIFWVPDGHYKVPNFTQKSRFLGLFGLQQPALSSICPLMVPVGVQHARTHLWVHTKCSGAFWHVLGDFLVPDGPYKGPNITQNHGVWDFLGFNNLPCPLQAI